MIDELEAERGIAPGTTKMLAMVETASAFFHIAEIARAHPRLPALTRPREGEAGGRSATRVIRFAESTRCKQGRDAHRPGFSSSTPRWIRFVVIRRLSRVIVRGDAAVCGFAGSLFHWSAGGVTVRRKG
jgi:hypothetical protein